MVFHPSHRPLEIATRFPQFHSPDDDDISPTNKKHKGTLLSSYRGGHFYWALTGALTALVAAIPVVVAWWNSRGAAATRLQAVEAAGKEVSFWESWLKTQKLVGEPDELTREAVRKRIELVGIMCWPLLHLQKNLGPLGRWVCGSRALLAGSAAHPVLEEALQVVGILDRSLLFLIYLPVCHVVPVYSTLGARLFEARLFGGEPRLYGGPSVFDFGGRCLCPGGVGSAQVGPATRQTTPPNPDFALATGRSTHSAAVVPRCAAACRRTASGSDAPRPITTSSSEHASRDVRRFSSAGTASSSATSS